MDILVQGVKIELTSSQLNKIKRETNTRKRVGNDLVRLLRKFEFKKIRGIESAYAHVKYEWYAEIIDYGNWKEVWMTGDGLKSSASFPGGWSYDSTTQLEEELSRAVDEKYNNLIKS